MEVASRPAVDPELAADRAAPPPAERWSVGSLIAFRFAFVYLLLYCYPGTGRVSLLEAIPFLPYAVVEWATAPWRALCPWVAVHLFRLSGPVTQYHPTGSGDTTLDYVQVFCFAAIAAVVTVVWSVLDRRRNDYRMLYPWLRLVVRFTLAFTLLSYGFAKIFPLQFGASPALSTLAQTYGESSPMRLLWTFMAASQPYQFFAGLCEAGAGMLLLFRRTSVLGALAAAAVMLNVAVLNYCYDVPVKLYSTHLFLMAVFLLLPELSALWRFFVLHANAQLARVWLPRFERRWLRVTAAVLQVASIVSVLGGNLWGGYTAMQQNGQLALKRPSVYGVWDVETANAPWKRVIVNSGAFMVAVASDGTRAPFMTHYSAQRRVTLKSYRTGATGELSFATPDRSHLELRGIVGGKPVALRAHRSDTSFLLMSRGFHWINEDPYNR